MVKYDMRDFGVGQIAENILENMSLTHLDLSWYVSFRKMSKQVSFKQQFFVQF